MKARVLGLVAGFCLISFLGCNKEEAITPAPAGDEKFVVVINDIPFQTEMFLRIPYTIRFYEFEKEGLKLQRIHVLDANTNTELMKIEKEEITHFYKDPLPQNPYMTQDKLGYYYFSIQLPIPLAQTKPTKITHKFDFRDTVNNKDVTMEGGILVPRLSESPLVIASPVKGNNWIFINQSTLEYHFFTLFFVYGKIFRGERFAFDNLRMDSSFTNYYKDDPTVNSNFYNYRDTLYAVAEGVVTAIKDGMVENNGNLHDHLPTTIDELGGNCLTLKIGNNLYAFYAHCVPNSFFVTVGQTIKEGDPIALLGNSGNSDAPHLHFEITDGPDILFSNGVPFVLKQYTKLGDADTGPSTPAVFQNAMMEQMTVIGF
ncbi:MAG TPA: M23 family metallopeptidase [Ignavibacteriaceae bacterium]|jgi:hypothetical protein|nr:M23 family metallopeptidase [Ignavibacteriaceae bacterium]HOJ19516.1 M23 family metallopeptidase [Ignavibacteriaceae bacterium]